MKTSSKWFIIYEFTISVVKVKKPSELAKFPAGICLLKVNNRNPRTRCKICSKLTIKTTERHHGVVLVSLLLTLNIIHTLLEQGFYCYLWASKCWLGYFLYNMFKYVLLMFFSNFQPGMSSFTFIISFYR